jgi:hypothetical protein
MSEHFSGSNKAFEILANLGGHPLHPQTCLGAFMSTADYCPAAIFNGAIDFCERHCASRVAHGDNGEKGVGREAGDDVGCSRAGWEIWQV